MRRIILDGSSFSSFWLEAKKKVKENLQNPLPSHHEGQNVEFEESVIKFGGPVVEFGGSIVEFEGQLLCLEE